MQIRCPTCRTLAAWEENPHRPFCSERCKLTDLGQWAAERYRIELSDASAGAAPETITDESNHAPHHHGPQDRS